jgi:hypothetical protein
LAQQQQQLPYYEPKIAEQNSARRSRSSLLNVLARNFKTIEKITLYLAFFINVILLFHRIDISEVPKGSPENDGAKGGEADAEEGEGEGEEDVVETIYIVSHPHLNHTVIGTSNPQNPSLIQFNF